MSRTLPHNPSLEYLKKEAKDLLKELQTQDASLRLADAQHTLAQDYGFASWPKLKAHLEALAGDTHAIAGKWKLNPQRSTRNTDLPVRDARLDITVAGDTVTIRDVTVTEAGERHRAENTLHADGRESTGAHGYSVRANWISARTLEWSVKQHGNDIAAGRYEVSEDGQSLAATAGNRRFIFDRQ
jgi:hypothetical protein